MLHQELPRHQDDHPEEHRPRHQLGVAIGSQQLPGEVGHDESHEGDGPHHRRGHSDGQGDPQQQPAEAPVIIHPQVDGLLLAQGEHIQQGQVPAEEEKDRRQHH